MLFLFNIILYSVLGFIFESIICLISNKPVIGNFTFGPYTLIYGLSLSFIFILYKFLDKKITNKILKFILFFILGIIILSLLEYFTGTTLEKLFNKEFWNYSNLPLTYNKYINLYVSIFWSLTSLLIYKFLLPITNKIYKYTKYWMINIMTSLILVDVFFSIINMI